jgi:hypothetical protein
VHHFHARGAHLGSVRTLLLKQLRAAFLLVPALRYWRPFVGQVVLLTLLDDEELPRITAATCDAMTFLWELHREGQLRLDFQPLPAELLYHAPCHSRIGGAAATPAEHVLRLIPGLSLRVAGGNPRTALGVGLPVAWLTIGACAAGGACAGLAGAVEVAAVHGAANASLMAGYGYSGILLAFAARFSPAGVVPVAILVGGIAASGSPAQSDILQALIALGYNDKEAALALGGKVPWQVTTQETHAPAHWQSSRPAVNPLEATAQQ